MNVRDTKTYKLAERIADHWTWLDSMIVCVAIWAAGVYAGIALWQWLVS